MQSGSNERPAFLAVLVSTFTTVFVAELGDKTQLATLLLSAQSGAPWLVFLGAATALIADGSFVRRENVRSQLCCAN